MPSRIQNTSRQPKSILHLLHSFPYNWSDIHNTRQQDGSLTGKNIGPFPSWYLYTTESCSCSCANSYQISKTHRTMHSPYISIPLASSNLISSLIFALRWDTPPSQSAQQHSIGTTNSGLKQPNPILLLQLHCTPV